MRLSETDNVGGMSINAAQDFSGSPCAWCNPLNIPCNHSQRHSLALFALPGVLRSEMGDAKGKNSAKLREGVELRERSAQHIKTDVTLTSRQRHELTRWDERTTVPALPLPKRPYSSSPASIQTPLHAELWSLLPSLAKEGQQPWTGQELPDSLR